MIFLYESCMCSLIILSCARIVPSFLRHSRIAEKMGNRIHTHTNTIQKLERKSLTMILNNNSNLTQTQTHTQQHERGTLNLWLYCCANST